MFLHRSRDAVAGVERPERICDGFEVAGVEVPQEMASDGDNRDAFFVEREERRTTSARVATSQPSVTTGGGVGLRNSRSAGTTNGAVGGWSHARIGTP